MTASREVPDPVWSGSADEVRRLEYTSKINKPTVLRDILEFNGMEITSDVPQIALRILRVNCYTIIHATAARGTFTWNSIRDRGDKRCGFIFVPRGRLTSSSAESRIFALNDSLLAIFPGQEPIEFGSDAPLEVIAFTFDAGDVALFGLGPGVTGVVRPPSGVIQSTYAMLRTLVSADSPELTHDGPAMRHLLRGAARALTRATRPPNTSLFDAANEVIATQHMNPALDPRRIAAQLGASLRGLYRAFSGREYSVAESLREARVQTARAILAESPNLSMRALAHASGFGSRTSLHRALQSVGRGPGESS